MVNIFTDSEKKLDELEKSYQYNINQKNEK